ncbi:hypothetical protein Hanom_Chr00s000434g01643541 [Helianthus anomalus]
MASGAREPKVSKAKGIKTCWFSAQALACLSTFFDSAFLAASPTTNPFSLKPTKGETPVRSTQEGFMHLRLANRVLTGLTGLTGL